MCSYQWPVHPINFRARTGVAQGPLGSLVILADHRHWEQAGSSPKAGIEMEAIEGE